jgi:hypothetical protein
MLHGLRRESFVGASNPYLQLDADDGFAPCRLIIPGIIHILWKGPSRNEILESGLEPRDGIQRPKGREWTERAFAAKFRNLKEYLHPANQPAAEGALFDRGFLRTQKFSADGSREP